MRREEYVEHVDYNDAHDDAGIKPTMSHIKLLKSLLSLLIEKL